MRSRRCTSGSDSDVAVSRAQCLSVVVASPRLLDADCRTLAAMCKLDGLCRYVELAEAIGAPPLTVA